MTKYETSKFGNGIDVGSAGGNVYLPLRALPTILSVPTVVVPLVSSRLKARLSSFALK